MSVLAEVETYPSTDDGWFDHEDPLLGCLLTARARVALGHSTQEYVDREGNVCAVGGVIAGDGLVYEDVPSRGFFQEPEVWRRKLEELLSKTAKEAIARLDDIATQRHPEAKLQGSYWIGVFEWVNQEWMPPGAERDEYGERDDGNPNTVEAVKTEILAIYDEAIGMRERELQTASLTFA